MIKLMINLEKNNIEIPVSVLAKDNAGFIGNCICCHMLSIQENLEVISIIK